MTAARYFDYAATTPLDPAALEAMLPWLGPQFANASALYESAQTAAAAIEEARERVAAAVGAQAEEIVFTSGGTESIWMAIAGVAIDCTSGTLLTTRIEHESALQACAVWRHLRTDLAPVDAEGIVRVEEVARLIRADTRIVSVMHANNEVGSVQPVGEIARICRRHRVPLHIDAVQTFGVLPIDVRRMEVDLLSVSSHKLYGPQGVGALYIRSGIAWRPAVTGGGQERGRRGGTTNVAGIVGFGSAVSSAMDRVELEARRTTALREALIEQIQLAVPDAILTGPRADRLPGNVHFCIPGVDGAAMVLALDARGIRASAGAACSAGSTDPSHVLLAMGLSPELARCGLRLTLGRGTTETAVREAAIAVASAVAELRPARSSLHAPL
ncbi:MAG: cysteine desulfurase [Armatimonadetes bacterium]|nr:cysteine desulfurase [Armatimonadota bacterium]MDE2207502.1 cysteine desulfurase [Armatimonadota bacterium]